MKTRNILAGCALVVLLFIGLWLNGCAGSRNDRLENETAALSGFPGDEVDQEADTVKSESDEDEVMRLLGLVKQDEAQQSATEASTAETGADTENLQSQSQQLEAELQQKNLEIANLRAEVAERDRRIAELESEMDKPEDTARAKVRSTGTYKERYNYARSLYEAKKYNQALQEFSALLASDINNELSDNAQYWIGECYYGLRAYNQAIIEFEKVFTFNRSDKYDDAQLKLGYCYLRIGNVEKARSELNKLITNYPDSEFVSKAQHYLQQL
ncbi:tetratricopeptide repeat protein [candidate division KSB1 bacterium]|nr:tetratricopeptide repeat protein [candidate division KSB1 bacterium]